MSLITVLLTLAVVLDQLLDNEVKHPRRSH
jgi:hypothetical protein